MAQVTTRSRPDRVTTRKRGRPNLSQGSVRIAIDLRLRPGEDDDLIEYFQGIPLRRRATAIKSALRSGGMQGAVASGAGGDEDLDEVVGNLLF